MFLLTTSLIFLLAGPLIYALLPKRHTWLHLLDGFIFVTIGGLVLFGIMPEAIARGGWWALPLAVLGAFLPTLSERMFTRFERQTHVVALVLGLSGLLLHAMTDGAILGSRGLDDQAELLSWGVLLHRVPVGLTIWWFLRPNYGLRVAAAVLAVIAGGTILGFALAPQVLETLSLRGMAWFQAFVAGTLIHVVFHRPHARGAQCRHEHASRWSEGLGNVIGAGLLVYLSVHHAHVSEPAWLAGAMGTLADLALRSAPALLLAYVMAGLATAFMPQSYIDWMGEGRSWKQSLRGMAVGLPLPICSCGVVPLYYTLIRKGTPPAAALAFLIATPELGIDAVLLSLPLLGGTMTAVRVAGAALTALLVGIAIGRVTRVLRPAPVETCCDTPEGSRPGWREKMRTGMVDGMGELVDSTGPWILAGMVVAAIAHPLLRASGLDWMPAALEVPAFALLGMPVYVCASGATPLIAVFLMTGVSPGAALAFLLTGPATNVTTFGVLARLHGKTTAVLFGTMTLALTVLLGYATNLVLPHFQPVAVGEEYHQWTWLHKGSLGMLLGLYLLSVLRRGARSFLSELFAQGPRRREREGRPAEASLPAKG